VAQAYFIHSDHLNTPRTITDTSGAVVWQWDNSDPFGNNSPNENPTGQGAFNFNLRFAGQYFDRETNTHYNINRDYDPATGRYIESDPIGLLGGINTYTYVKGNPISHVDPTGENIFMEIIVIGGLIIGGYQACTTGYEWYKDWTSAQKSVDDVIEKTKVSQEEMKKCVSTGACGNVNKAMSEADEAKGKNLDAARQLGKDATNAIPDVVGKAMK
jgi:RHS repeat-associated protein